jgi:hypothetical protein
MNRIDELFAEVWLRPDDVELRLVLGMRCSKRAIRAAS